MRVTPNLARTGPAREAPHVTKEMPIDHRDNDLGVSGRALAILKFFEIASPKFGGLGQVGFGAARVGFT